MHREVLRLTRAYESKGILVDANLFLLLAVGLVDRALIQRCKRTKQYSPQEFDLLSRYLAQFKQRVTTPNVLTEVSNLAGCLSGNQKDRTFAAFSRIIANLREEYLPSGDLARQSEFLRFGLTDAAVISVAKGRFLLLTDDFCLAQYYSSKGGDVINFNHLRALAWS
jgi:hypothetical protein